MNHFSGPDRGGPVVGPQPNDHGLGHDVDFIAAPAVLTEWAGWLHLRGSFALALRRIDATAVSTHACLTAAEVAQGTAFAAERRQQQWLAGRIVAKHAAARLSSRTGSAGRPGLRRPEGWTVVAEHDGRPVLQAIEAGPLRRHAPDLSISHSGDFAVAMAASHGRCGIDIQRFTKKILKVRPRFCLAVDDGVLTTTAALRDVSAIGRYTLLWVAKEALIKAASIRFMDVALERIMPRTTGTKADGYLIECRRIGSVTVEPYRLLAFLMPDYAMAFVVLEESGPAAD